jgi:hypothetical protein
MCKTAKTAAELEAMILDKMQALSEFPARDDRHREASRRNLGSTDDVAKPNRLC